MTFQLEYITDANGKQKSVVVPSKQWNSFRIEHNKLKKKLEILLGIKQAMNEVKRIRSGKVKVQTLRELLNEL